jgi:sulfur carrier protein
MAEQTKTVTINGKHEPLQDASLDLLMQRMGRAETGGIAVALNDAVVPRSQWRNTPLNPGDHIEIVVAVQGG